MVGPASGCTLQYSGARPPLHRDQGVPTAPNGASANNNISDSYGNDDDDNSASGSANVNDTNSEGDDANGDGDASGNDNTQ